MDPKLPDEAVSTLSNDSPSVYTYLWMYLWLVCNYNCRQVL